jgi:N-acetylglutamate synthase-like GNAT family acetyltransferase
MGHELLPPATPDVWQAFHDIRRIELFESKGRHGVYDDRHPDDFAPANQPLLFRVDGRPLGALRLDDRGDGTGVVRLVAVSSKEQGKGHGRIMQQLLDELARQRGMRELYINSAPTAVGFYEKTGWTRHVWDETELVGIAAECVQMRKPL